MNLQAHWQTHEAITSCGADVTAKLREVCLDQRSCHAVCIVLGGREWGKNWEGEREGVGKKQRMRRRAGVDIMVDGQGRLNIMVDGQGRLNIMDQRSCHAVCIVLGGREGGSGEKTTDEEEGRGGHNGRMDRMVDGQAGWTEWLMRRQVLRACRVISAPAATLMHVILSITTSRAASGSPVNNMLSRKAWSASTRVHTWPLFKDGRGSAVYGRAHPRMDAGRIKELKRCMCDGRTCAAAGVHIYPWYREYRHATYRRKGKCWSA
eukprot:366124-Chlamydomonas_euryale.AAC.14